MTEWMETTIGELAQKTGGSIKTGPFGTALKASEYTQTGVPLISVKEIGNGSFNIDERTPKVDHSVTNRLPEYLLEANDIVFARKGSVDRSAIVTEAQTGWFLGSDGIRLRLPKGVNSRFVYYWVSSRTVKSWLLQQATGSTMASLNQKTLSRVPISIPPENMQDAIAAVLTAFDDKIELNRRMNETLEAMAQAIFKDWFVDFGPPRRKLTGETNPVAILGGLLPTPEQATPIAALFPAAFGDNGLPEGWEEGILGDYAINSGKTVSPSDVSDDTPYIGLEHMPRRSVALSEWETSGKVTSNKSQFKEGQVLFGKLRPYFHKVGIAAVSGVCSTDIVVLDGKKPEYRSFVAACTSSTEFVEYTDKTSTGTKMPRTSWKIMQTYPVALATGSVVEAYHDLATPLFARLKVAIHESNTLAQTRDLLLPKLMSGEIRVAEAEAIAEEVA